MGPIRYMARNHVAANILMAFLLVGGLLSIRTLKVEVFPEVEMDMVNISVAYPGAGPEEVEEGILRPIEEAIQGLEGIKRIYATAREGGGGVTIDVVENADVDQVLQDAKSAVDRIITFPQQAERPVIQKVMRRRSVITVMLHGRMDLHTLRQRAEKLRDDLLALKQVTQADLEGVPPPEIAIEVPEANLRRYGLTLDQVAAAVRAASLDLPAGGVKTRGGEVLLRTKERRYTAREYEDVVVVSKTDGTLLKLGSIADVQETFMETDERAFFNGEPGALVEVFRVGNQTPLEISRAVKAHVAEQRGILPPGVKLDVWRDRSEILQARMDLLLRNAVLGLILVIIVLGLFLQIRLAFWVTLGIPLSMLGSLLLVPWFDVSINMISLFAFIVVLGIVVDDAIVVGENVFTHRGKGKAPLEAAVDGTKQVARPVVFAVLTTVAAVAPLLFISGMMGKFMINMPIIIITVLMFSLVESLFILPAHLSRSKPPDESRPPGPFRRFHGRFARLVAWGIRVPYTGTLKLALRYRYVTLALAVATVMGVAGLFAGKHIKFIFMPVVEGDLVQGKLTMPFGTPVEQTEKHVRRLLAEAQKLVGELEAREPGRRKILRSIYMVRGAQMRYRGGGGTGSHLGEVAVYLVDSGERNVTSQQFAQLWRQRVGPIPGAEALEFDSRLMHMGNAVDIQLAHHDFSVLEEAAERVKEALGEYPGLFDIRDSQEAGKRELELKLSPTARSLGITQRELASQVRGAFYGAEALRLQRERNEVRVMVRYPLAERSDLASVDDMRIRTPSGGELPFAQAASVAEGRGYSAILRTDRKRVINVTARANLKLANPAEIIEQLKGGLLAQLKGDYQGLTYDLEGQMRERRESFESMRWGFLMALVGIFALLAIPFRSYSQPLIIMSAIPFGIVGAVLGHMLMGYDMSLISMMGVVALTGVVVNDSLVMIDFINRYRGRHGDLFEAVIEGGRRRFRPIILTTLTTFFALVPMLAETSVQARFLVPMAISLGFGVLFATFITLILIPTLYVILEDLRRGVAWALGRPRPLREAPDKK
jgi:multidrug efflux pump subunit AcrB